MSVKEFLHSRTPAGRYAEYRSAHAAEVQGIDEPSAYAAEAKLDKEAKAYATRKVALDILGTAVLATGAVVIGNEIAHKRLTSDIKKVGSFVRDFPQKFTHTISNVPKNVGGQIVSGAVSELNSPDVSNAAADAVAKVTKQASARIVADASNSVGAASSVIGNELKRTALNAGAEAGNLAEKTFGGIEKTIKALRLKLKRG